MFAIIGVSIILWQRCYLEYLNNWIKYIMNETQTNLKYPILCYSQRPKPAIQRKLNWSGVEGWGENADNCNWITIKIKIKKKLPTEKKKKTHVSQVWLSNKHKQSDKMRSSQNTRLAWTRSKGTDSSFMIQMPSGVRLRLPDAPISAVGLACPQGPKTGCKWH